jgi:hypothetical protein
MRTCTVKATQAQCQCTLRVLERTESYQTLAEDAKAIAAGQRPSRIASAVAHCKNA